MDYPDKVKDAYDKVRTENGTIPVFKAEVPYPVHGDRWGKWEFDAESLVLKYRESGRNEYEIDLQSMTSSAEMIDWIFQLSMKTWVSRQEIGDLVRALDDLLRPQSNLCSGGKDKHFDPVKYMRDHLRTGLRRDSVVA
jgi:hypothetical protein